MSKPKIFIGSSTESLKFAQAVQSNLDYVANITIWTQGFKPSNYIVEELERISNNIDFAILILSPDDISIIRAKKYKTVRDNIIFELGFFIAKLGRERTFLVIPRDTEKFLLPGDLDGLIPLTFDLNNKELRSTFGSVAFRIEEVIQKLGCLENKVSEFILNPDKITSSKSRAEHYEFTSKLLSSAEKSVYIIERTPVLLFGPRYLWYEKNYYDALNTIAKKTLNSNFLCSCLYCLEDTKKELNDSNLKKVVANLKRYKEIEKKSKGRFSITSIPQYLGSFLVSDQNSSVWFKGNTNSISIYQENNEMFAKTLIEIFNRLNQNSIKSFDVLVSELNL